LIWLCLMTWILNSIVLDLALHGIFDQVTLKVT